jgi:hypothetical protein
MPAELPGRRRTSRARSELPERACKADGRQARLALRPGFRTGDSPSASEPWSRAIAVAVTALALSFGAFASPAAAASVARTPAAELPPCPPASKLTTALHQRLGHPTAHLGRIGSITFAGFGPEPAGTTRRAAYQYERTCTYARGSVTPITVSFVAPVTSAQFTAARIALARSVGVVVLGGLGAPAWRARGGGLLFVLRGRFEVVVSASATSVADLTALARELG